MSGLLGFPKNKTLDGLTTGYFDNSYVIRETVENETITEILNSTSISNSGNINSSTYNSISSSYISNLPTYETNTDATLNSLQTQISNITSTSTSGGGYFIIEYESNNIAIANTNGYNWSSGSGQRFQNLYGTVPSCNLIAASIYLSANVTSNTVIAVLKNNVNSLSITIPINTAFVKVSSLNVAFSFADTIQIRTTSGSTVVAGRISLIFSTDGIKGTDGISPNLSIGTVSSLATGNNPTASISGTQANPVLNLGLVTGQTGLLGAKGADGISPSLSIGTVSSLATGNNPTASISGTQANPVLNLGLVSGVNGIDGVSPSLTIGTVSSLAWGNNPTASISGMQANPVLNLGIVSGERGEKGEQGDPGPKGKDADVVAITTLTATAVGAAGTAGIAATASATSMTASGVSATASNTSAIAAREAADEVNAKLYYFEADVVSGVQKCKKTLNIINSGLETIVKLSNNDQSEFRNKVQFDDNIISKGTITNYENNSLNISSATTLNLSSTTVINIEAPTINIGYSNLSSTIYLNGVVVRPLDDFFNMFSTNNGNITQVGF